VGMFRTRLVRSADARAAGAFALAGETDSQRSPTREALTS
jgi:hypothetical protein